MIRHFYSRMHNAQYIKLVKLLSDNCRTRWMQATRLQFFGSGIESIVTTHRSNVSFADRRSMILLPNHFRRLIPQFEFARACARNHPISLPTHIPAIKRKWTLDRPISSRFLLSFLLRYHPPPFCLSPSFSHPARIYALFSVSGSTHKQARSSLEKCMGWYTTL